MGGSENNFLKVHRWIFRAISHRHTALSLKSISDKNICRSLLVFPQNKSPGLCDVSTKVRWDRQYLGWGQESQKYFVKTHIRKMFATENGQRCKTFWPLTSIIQTDFIENTPS